MSELLERLREDFQNEEARYAYVEAHLNASIAAQIKKLRGNESQVELAARIGTKQSGISRLENANYAAWKVETLRKLARGFGLRLKISFEEFGTLLPEITNFKNGVLQKRSFEKDLIFNPSKEPKTQRKAVASEDHRKAMDELSDIGTQARTGMGMDINGGSDEVSNPPEFPQKMNALSPISIQDERDRIERRNKRRGRVSGYGRRKIAR